MAALRTSMTPDAKLAGTIVAQSQLAIKTGEAASAANRSTFIGKPGAGRAHHEHAAQAGEGSGAGSEADRRANHRARRRLWGIYVGEVIRRYYGGQWSLAATACLDAGARRPQRVLRSRRSASASSTAPTDNIRYYFTSMLKVAELSTIASQALRHGRQVVAALGHQDHPALAERIRLRDQRRASTGRTLRSSCAAGRADPVRARRSRRRSSADPA